LGNRGTNGDAMPQAERRKSCKTEGGEAGTVEREDLAGKDIIGLEAEKK